MLTPGEFVMTRAATQRIGVSTLRALNGGAKGYNRGGMVGMDCYAQGDLVSPSVRNQLGDAGLIKQVESFGIAVHSMDQIIREFVEGQGLVIKGVNQAVAAAGGKD